MTRSPSLEIGCLLLAAACSAPDQDVDGSDYSVLYPTLRAIIDTTPDKRRARPRDPEKSDFILSVEADVTGTWGDFDPEAQVLGTANFAMMQASLAARPGAWLGDQFRIEAIAGLGYNYFELEVEGGNLGLQGQKHINRFGPLIGAQIGWVPASRFELYARATFLPLMFDSTSAQAEGGMTLGISDNVHLLGAYRYWRFRTEELEVFNTIDADLDLRTSGFVFGLVLEF